MSKLTGPLLNRNYYLQDMPRAFFSDLPIGIDALDYEFQRHEFDKTLVTGEFTTVKDSGATVATSGSNVVITSTTTTDADGGSIQGLNLQYLVKSGKKLWFEARVKVSDADQGPMFVGLTEAFATNPEAVIVAGIARVGFELLDGSAVLNMVIDNDTASTKVTTGMPSMADNTYVKLGFRTYGDYVLFYVNRSYVGKVALPTAIAAIPMAVAFEHLSGNNTGTHTAHCDYIYTCQER